MREKSDSIHNSSDLIYFMKKLAKKYQKAQKRGKRCEKIWIIGLLLGGIAGLNASVFYGRMPIEKKL